MKIIFLLIKMSIDYKPKEPAIQTEVINSEAYLNYNNSINNDIVNDYRHSISSIT